VTEKPEEEQGDEEKERKGGVEAKEARKRKPGRRKLMNRTIQKRR